MSPYVVSHNPDITRKNNTATVATQLFRIDTNDEYDRVWHIEYDVCYIGDWADFFRKYEKVDSDFITAWNYERPESIFGWFHFKWMEAAARDKVKDNPWFAVSLNCCCRLSRRLLQDICGFLKEFGFPGFQEWVFPTVANMKGYQTLFFSSPHFRPNLKRGFKVFSRGNIYHPLKLDICLEKILNHSKG